MIDVAFRNVCVEILAFNEPQEKFIYNLDMRPSNFQDGLIFLRVKSLALKRQRWRNGTKKVFAEHLNHTRVHGLCDDRPVVGNIIQELVQRQALDLFRLHISGRIIEVEDDIALVNLLHEQILTPVRGHFMKSWQLLQFSLALVRNIKS